MAPELASTTPLSGASEVAIDTDITLVFNEPVEWQGMTRTNGSGNTIELIRSSDDQLIETFTVPQPLANNTFTLDPTSDLQEGTNYYIKISPIAFYDNSNNPFAGISDTSSLTFRTYGFPLNLQTITFGQLTDDTVSSGSRTVNATASSGLTVSFTSNTTNVCSVENNEITYITIGICSITASQNGSDLYSAAPVVTRAFNVTAEDTDGDGIVDSEDAFPNAVTEQTTANITLSAIPFNGDSSCGIHSLVTETVPTSATGFAVNGSGVGISFALSNCDVNNPESLVISILLDAVPPEGSVVMKIDDDGNWSSIEGSTIDGAQITYTLRDNGPLDQDPVPGRIADPVTLAVPIVQPASRVPTLSVHLLMALAGLLALLGTRRARAPT